MHLGRLCFDEAGVHLISGVKPLTEARLEYEQKMQPTSRMVAEKRKVYEKSTSGEHLITTAAQKKRKQTDKR